MSKQQDLLTPPAELTPGVDDPMEAHAQASVDINPEAVSAEFVRLPSDLAFWNNAYASAMKAHLKAKRDLKSGEATIKVALRNSDPPHGKWTEGSLDEQLNLNKQYQLLLLRVDETRVAQELVAGTVEAIRAKRDMLISLGATQRAELLPMSMNQR